MNTFYKCNYVHQVFFVRFRNCSKYVKYNLQKLLQTMPKEPKHIEDAQKQRIKIKEKLSRYSPGRVTLQVLGTGAEGAPRSLYVFSDQSRYLFNCGEGTQRLAHEHKMKLAKLEHIFITQPVWKNIGGLPGTALTIQDVGVPIITLHGPKGLDEMFAATRRFIVIRDLEIKMADCDENNTFEDNVMTVEYVPLQPVNKEIQVDNSIEMVDCGTSTGRFRRRNRSPSNSLRNRYQEEDDTDYYAHERKRKRRRSRRRSKSNRSRSQSLSESGTRPEANPVPQRLLRGTKEDQISMAYVCKLQPKSGALILEKCVRFGVPAGPLLGRIKGGETITLDNGKVVKPSDVCEPDDPGPVFIVVDCPSEDYLSSLMEHPSFKKYQAGSGKIEDHASLVVHFSPKKMTDHPTYQKWMSSFSSITQHLVLNESNTCMGSVAVHRIQHKLHLLNPNIFPLLGDTGSLSENNSGTNVQLWKRMKTSNESITSEVSCTANLPSDSKSEFPVIYPNTFCTFHLRPRKGLDRSTELRLDPTEYVRETMSLNDFEKKLEKLKQGLSVAYEKIDLKLYPKVLFLGTGSCIPNKTRNTSGILLQVSDETKVVVDCGEGTYGQLVRFFGLSQSDRVLSKIKAIYISHLHADHHIGLVGLLIGRRRAFNRLGLKPYPVFLLAPQQIQTWLNFYDRCFETISSEFELIPNADLLQDDYELKEDVEDRVLDSLEMSRIRTTLVRHCPNAFGVCFTLNNQKMITYSGDTMPCENLLSLGHGSDLLIHEATMEDELAAEAVVKMHSTMSQAVEIGQKMQAKNIILTHFSQRYAKLPRFNDDFLNNIGIAFDNMQFTLEELALLPLLYPILKIMFAEHYEELEHKSIKRQLRIERSKQRSRENSPSK